MIHDKIKFQRKRYNLSQEQLAGILNVSKSTINNWESSKAVPTLQHLIFMSYYFKVSVNYFIDDSIGNDELILNNLNSKQKQIIYDLISVYSEDKL